MTSIAEKKCINCENELIQKQGIWLCNTCNSEDLKLTHLFEDEVYDDGYIFIECPGATLYQEGSNQVENGVEFHDRDNPHKGYKIVGKAVYAPTHKKRRRIKKELAGKISRCQGCQDYTVRMRRREGVDFFIPSTKYPGRKKLKTVEHVPYEPV